MRKIGACAALVAALALPATASAEKVKLEGTVTDVPSSKVKVGVKKKHGEIRKITSMKFRKVPVTCSDGSSGAINGNLPLFPVRGNDFTRKAKIRGTGIESGFVKVAGKFRRGGKVVKGTVRFSFKSESGAGCGTDEQAFKATK
ncbi:MAG: hypothetical protein GEU88_08950 [Solirubrobacterales bacterium]|nr:hypothetical protein [Solirubrobacterales bacterium]